MNPNQEQNQVNERLGRIEQKLEELENQINANKRTSGRRVLKGGVIMMITIVVLMMTIGVIQFVSNG